VGIGSRGASDAGPEKHFVYLALFEKAGRKTNSSLRRRRRRRKT